MGVKGLQSFIEKHCHPRELCYQHVSIERLVEDYKRKTDGQQPTIVFDGASILRYLYEGGMQCHLPNMGKLDWVAGGQFTQYLERIKDFVNAFKALGVHVVFFFGGTKHDASTHAEWQDRNTEKVKKVQELLFRLKRFRSASDIDSNLFRFPTNLGFSHYFKELFDVEVRIVARYEAEIANYARENKCLAIFGQDTDFLIYEGGKYYLSMQHFDIRSMTSVNYDRNGLARVLGLSPSQLPILATLGGNGFVKQAELKNFHRDLCRERHLVRYEVLFPALGRYIQEHLPRGDALLETLPNLAREIFGDEAKASILKKSIHSYLPTSTPTAEPDHPHWAEIIRRAEELHEENLNSAVILNTLMGRPYRCSVVTEDLSKIDLPPSACLMRPLRQRLYGIILMEKPPEVEPHFVQEWSSEEDTELGLRRPFFVFPLPPAAHHPGLLTLWSDDRSEQMQNIRWKLFAHTVSLKLKPEDLEKLPDHLVLPTSTLFYLKENKIFETWEVDALLATVTMLPSISLEQLQDLPNDHVNLRAVQIATIFMRALQTVVRLLSACGYPFPRNKAFQYPYFDGKLFQEKYHQASSRATQAELCEHQVSALETFKKVRHILFKDT